MTAGGRGLVQVYTGEGKGKTTAALGLALRAVGHGHRVLFVQFMKEGGPKAGEALAASKLPGFEVHRFGRSFVYSPSPEPEEVRADISLGLAFVREQLAEGGWDLVVLDEINVALSRGLASEEEVLALLAARPPHAELVLTGRGAPRSIMDAADLVTEMVQVKHPYEEGVPARRGIEY